MTKRIDTKFTYQGTLFSNTIYVPLQSRAYNKPTTFFMYHRIYEQVMYNEFILLTKKARFVKINLTR